MACCTVPRSTHPVGYSLSPKQASTQTIPFQVATRISQNHPLRDKEAGDSMRQHLAKLSKKAAEEGLTEADVSRMLNEE